MPSITSMVLLLSFVCLMTGIFTPDLVIKWGIPSLKKQKNRLILFGVVMVGGLFLYALKADHPVKITETIGSSSIVSAKSGEISEKVIHQIGEIGLLDNISLQLNQIHFIDDMMSIEITLKNQSDESVDYHPYQFILKNNLGDMLVPNLEDETSLKSGVLLPGDEVIGHLMYDYKVEEYWFEYCPIPTNRLSTITFAIGSKNVNEMNNNGIGDIISQSNVQLQVTQIQKLEQIKENKPKEGHQFIKVDVSLKNISEKTMTLFPYHFELINQFNDKQKPSTSLIETENLLTIKEVISGGIIQGSLMFEVPKDSQNLKLNYNVPSLMGTDSILIDLELENERQPELKPSLSFNEEWLIGQRLDSIQLERMSLTVFSSHPVIQTEHLIVDEEKSLLGIEVELENEDDIKRMYAPHDFKLLTSTGELLWPRLIFLENEQVLQSGTLSPSERIEGTLVFEVDKKINDYGLIYSPNQWKGLQQIMIPLF